MRTFLIAGNWKMNQLRSESAAFAQDLSRSLQNRVLHSELLLFPPFLSIDAVRTAQGADERIQVGAQNCSSESSGAFTGEVSAAMVRDAGCSHVLVGHSERREYFGEDEAVCLAKIRQALGQGLHVVYCVGEHLEQRRQGRQTDVVKAQLAPIYQALTSDEAARLSIAYEPVWAIGTGETASPEQAQDMHVTIRDLLSDVSGDATAESTRILYGGSMKPANAGELLRQPDVDGGLIGGASLTPGSYLAIVDAAEAIAAG